MNETVLSWLPLLGAPFVGWFLGVTVDWLLTARPVTIEQCGAGPEEETGPSTLVPVVTRSWSRSDGQSSGRRNVRLVLVSGASAIAVWSIIVTSGWIAVASCLLGWTLLALCLIDLERFILPDVLTLPLLAAGLVVGYLIDAAQLADHVAGAVVGYLALVAVRYAYQALRGREGLGLGDVKLLAAIGAWVTWSGLPSVILLAACLGLLVGIVRAVAARRAIATERLPFGPFLAGACWLVWLHGPLALA